MKRGLDFDPVAAAQYTEITGNQVYMCGFVINPNTSHLGTAPDRKVLQSSYDISYGLLEIKCPDQYLQKHNGDTYSLKRNHEYYYQVIGQMRISGMLWCDFFVKCDNEGASHVI